MWYIHISYIHHIYIYIIFAEYVYHIRLCIDALLRGAGASRGGEGGGEGEGEGGGSEGGRVAGEAGGVEAKGRGAEELSAAGQGLFWLLLKGAEAWLDKVEGCINIAVVGNSGVGKSLLINRLRRLRPKAEGWAPVGVNETTREPTMQLLKAFQGISRLRSRGFEAFGLCFSAPRGLEAPRYPYPSQPSVRLWDLPGAGTVAVPAETYLQDMGLRYFDRVVVVSAQRFTEMEVAPENRAGAAPGALLPGAQQGAKSRQGLGPV